MSEHDTFYSLSRIFLVLGILIITGFTVHNHLELEANEKFVGDRNKIIMYSQTTCGYCDQKRAELNNKKIQFTEYFVDTDRSREKELFVKLGKAGYKTNYYTTPTFDVYGIIMPHNPSVQEIERNIKKYTPEVDSETGLNKYRG